MSVTPSSPSLLPQARQSDFSDWAIGRVNWAPAPPLPPGRKLPTGNRNPLLLLYTIRTSWPVSSAWHFCGGYSGLILGFS